MSVNPVATGQWSEVPKKTSEPGSSNAQNTFAEILSGRGNAAGEEAVTPSTAAEVLRLKMLSAALNLGGEQAAPPDTQSTVVQGLLNKFLEQLPKGGNGSGSNAGAAGNPGNVFGDYADAIDPLSSESPRQNEDLGPNPTIAAIIDKASRRYGVDAGLIRAVIKQESNFNPRAVSSAGAQGLMQLMPSTARGLGVTDSFDPEQNVMAGTRFLKDMLQRYGNVDEALAAYNWGPGNVDRRGLTALPRETRDYLAKVKGYYTQYVG